MILEFIPPDNVRQTWPYVRQGLETVLQKSPEQWIPEDVYASLMAGKSVLWLLKRDEYCVGFLVGYAKEDEFHIWCAYGMAGGELDKWFAILTDIARKGGAKRITFDSWRPGWNRVAKKLGFKPRSWAMEI
jgi:hypothetical protein